MTSSGTRLIDHTKKKTMTYAAIVSLVLHVGLALTAVWLLSTSVDELKTDKLLIELAGMVANRQREESAPATAASTPTPPKKVQAKEEPKKSTPVKQLKAIAADSPVQVVQREEQATPLPKVLENKKDSELQKQETLNTLNKDLEELKKYQVKITKKIKSNLVYPSEARKRGYEGVTAVRFVVTESGMIQSGTLVIVRSSGYPMLDTSALKSVRDSEPFERPPRTMPVEIDLGFSS